MTAAPVVVIGAGPAGLTATITLATAGLPVILVDAGERPGGQYWRHTDDPGSVKDPILRRLLRRLAGLARAGLVDHRAGREAWLITAEEPGHRVELRPTAALAPAGRESVLTERLVLCPGAQDRQFPVPGWDLPGVMAAGGVQALLKGQRTAAGRRIVVAGSGPFLLPVATELARAGATVVSVCEAAAPSGWLRSAGAVAGVPSKIIEGAGYAAELFRRRIPYRSRTIVGGIEGGGRVESVRLDRVDRAGRVTVRGAHEVAVDTVALGWGFVPALELIMMVGAATELSAGDVLVATVDADQRCTVPGVYAAGEACGVGGATLARAEGELAARTLLADRVERPDQAIREGLRRRIRRHRAFATAMHRAHPTPTGWADDGASDTVLCRCEEVTVGAARSAAAELGAAAGRDYKLLSRCGMGWCQGRICGPAVADLAARLQCRTVTADDHRAYAKRTFAVPVPLAELARLAEPVADE